MSKHRSYKRFIGYSTAFRQWKADSHCNMIHGYAFAFKVWFEGELDDRGWVIDFGCFKRNGVKEWMKDMFDHTTCVAADDPELELFKEMDKRGMIDLRVLDGGVGCEKFAELIGNYLQEIVHKETDGRVKVHKCQVWEHEDNMAEYYV
jgi:6-pyruvoyltetrahydropterin/6-carboxytetrahydropterin synthase|tara:strand:+ start:3198 stop:3641 length:444 start_codon:yes stop_codon:yes gene_type:complete